MVSKRKRRTSIEPASYRLARSRSRALEAAYNELSSNVTKNGGGSGLLGFRDVIGRGLPAINMTVPNCVRFLELGRWFNIYEIVSLETGKFGRELQVEVQRRIPNWFTQRTHVETILRLGRDTHYASLNLGGPGPTRYGECCVVLGSKLLRRFATCFAGDSIRAVFQSDGRPVMNTDEILEKFATYESRALLAVLRHANSFEWKTPGSDAQLFRNVLEASDSLLEVHLVGEVVRSHVEAIQMTRRTRDHLWELARRADGRTGPLPQEYDVVPSFLRLLQLLQEWDIPLRVVDGS